MTSQWHGGKGSKPRPTDQSAYESGYDAIFRKKEPAEPVESPPAPDTNKDSPNE